MTKPLPSEFRGILGKELPTESNRGHVRIGMFIVTTAGLVPEGSARRPGRGARSADCGTNREQVLVERSEQANVSGGRWPRTRRQSLRPAISLIVRLVTGVAVLAALIGMEGSTSAASSSFGLGPTITGSGTIEGSAGDDVTVGSNRRDVVRGNG